jgi:hypothetical protein
MMLSQIVPLAAIATASLITGVVLTFVLRARRLNNGDLCGLCARLLPLEDRYRFHGRTMCARCARRLRYLTLPRFARVIVLLTIWGLGAAALVAMFATRDPEFLLWAPLFGGLVLTALLVGAVPAPSHSDDRTASTLQRLHALRTDPIEKRPRSSH